MSDSLAKRVLLAIAARLQAITVEDGFHTDAGAHVNLGQRSYDQLAAGEVHVSVFRGRSTATDDAQDHLLAVGLPVVIEAHLGVNTADAGEAAEDLLGDLKKAVLKDEDRSLLGLVRNRLAYLGDEAVYPEPGSSVVSVRVLLNARMRETYGDPYANE